MKVEAGPKFDFTDHRQWMPKFIPLLRTNKRKRVAYGSRGDGKSTVHAQSLMMDMLDGSKKIRGLMVRKRANSIKESQVATFRQVAEMYGYEKFFTFSETTNKIRAFNGNTLIALGMDDPGKAKSIPNPNRLWIEEADELTEEDYRQLSLSLRGTDVVEYLAFNAPYIGHWLISRFFPGQWNTAGGTPSFEVDLSFERPDGNFTVVESPDPNVFLIHGNYLQNPFCTQNIIEDMERDRLYHPEDYRRTGLGLIGRRNVGSLWLKRFDRSRHIQPRKFDPAYPVHLTFDQNKLPYNTCLMIQVVPVPEKRIKEIRIIKEYCMKPPRNSSEHTCEEFIYDWGQYKPSVYIYGDPSGSSGVAQKTKNEAKSHYDAIERALHPFLAVGHYRVGKAHPSIGGRQRFMERLLAEGIGELRLVIDPSCKYTIGDFEHLVEDENGGFVKKVHTDKETGQSWQERGHCADSTIYMLSKCFPERYKEVARV